MIFGTLFYHRKFLFSFILISYGWTEKSFPNEHCLSLTPLPPTPQIGRIQAPPDRPHSGRTPVALRPHSGRTPGALRPHSGRTPAALRPHSGRTPAALAHPSFEGKLWKNDGKNSGKWNCVRLMEKCDANMIRHMTRQFEKTLQVSRRKKHVKTLGSRWLYSPQHFRHFLWLVWLYPN